MTEPYFVTTSVSAEIVNPEELACRLGFLPQQIKIIILYATFSQTASQIILSV